MLFNVQASPLRLKKQNFPRLVFIHNLIVMIWPQGVFGTVPGSEVYQSMNKRLTLQSS